MPSTFSHLATGATLGYTLYSEKKGWRFWFLILLCSIIADFDVLAFKFGLKYSHLFGHRGFFHSIAFSIVLGLCFAACIYYQEKENKHKLVKLFLVFFSISLLHIVLDGFTNGGLGIAYFSPFTNHRYFFPVRPIKVSPIGVKDFFSKWGFLVILNEIKWLWIPFFSIAFTTFLGRIFLKRKSFLKKKLPDTTRV